MYLFKTKGGKRRVAYKKQGTPNNKMSSLLSKSPFSPCQNPEKSRYDTSLSLLTKRSVVSQGLRLN